MCIEQHIFNLTEGEFVRNQRELLHDRKYEAELNAAAEAAGEAAAGQFGCDAEDGLDVEAPDDEGGLDLDAGDDTGGDLDIESPEEDAPADDEPLLAAPSRRDDRGRRTTTTAKSKSHYTPKAQRGGDNRSGRQQSYLATALPKPKDVIPGSSDLKSLSRGIYESKQSTYLKEEKNIFDTSAEVKKLILELENTETHSNEDETQQEA